MHKTSLHKVGDKVMLDVPAAFLDALHWQAGATVGLAIEKGRLVVEPAPRPHFTLAQLLAEAQAQDVYPLPPSEREWIDTPAVGHELL